MVDAAGVELDIRSGTGLIPRIPRETKRSNHSIRSNAWVQVQNRYTDLSATRRVEDEAYRVSRSSRISAALSEWLERRFVARHKATTRYLSD